MNATRQDAWTDQEDTLLANIVLHHIRNGSTQLQAFDEAGVKLKRTSAACGFRWNSNIRKQYQADIQLAKEQKKKSKFRNKITTTEQSENVDKEQLEPNSLEDAVQFFKQIKTLLTSIDEYKNENEKLKAELIKLKRDQALEMEKAEETESRYQKIQEEYYALISLLDQARKITVNLDMGQIPTKKTRS
ncbi:RsfA family transcriptional regulator [Pseudogracilibacillus auburnensis]|uniref:RsfA family transcriptional regulator n=1 Tax=Pseudogracilibacillus auburnensis TaxID=1494959 RepID=UPI001A963188|nr:RsfA family transcriptional regulator [Pseudogracilibacillus auburnensis]MBO1004922.1 RsfA family transcriptional regulator [Pseudogracilibacillus auburnensis]